jgi:hypothetical protein
MSQFLGALAATSALATRSAAAVEGVDRGVAQSPAGVPSAQARKKILLALAKEGKYEAALNEVLSAMDISWVHWLLKKFGDAQGVLHSKDAGKYRCWGVSCCGEI